MSVVAIVYGPSGAGKSTSMRRYEDGEIGLINVLGKPLPFRGRLRSISTTDYERIKQAVAASKAKTIVIDDAGYLITDMFMSRHSSAGKGNGVFSLYNEIGDEFYKLLRFIAQLDDPDKIVFVVMHEDFDDYGNSKIRTIGKLLDEKVLIPGMVSVLIHACIRDGEYLFEVNGDGLCKTPDGMFDVLAIPNDLRLLDETMRDYWHMAPLSKGGEINGQH